MTNDIGRFSTAHGAQLTAPSTSESEKPVEGPAEEQKPPSELGDYSATLE